MKLGKQEAKSMIEAVGAGQYSYNLAELVNGSQDKMKLQTQKIEQETKQQIQQQQIQQQQQQQIQQQQIAAITSLGTQLDMLG